MAPTILYVVTGNNHDYDVMSEWVVGAYTSKKRAQTAIKLDEKEYWRWNGKDATHPSYEITKVSVNAHEPWGNT